MAPTMTPDRLRQRILDAAQDHIAIEWEDALFLSEILQHYHELCEAGGARPCEHIPLDPRPLTLDPRPPVPTTITITVQPGGGQVAVAEAPEPAPAPKRRK